MHNDRDGRFDAAPLNEDGRLLPTLPSWEQQQASTFLDDGTCVATEPAWQAMTALHKISSGELHDVLQHPSFRLMPPNAMVSVSPCRICAEGALRTAGTLQTSLGKLVVRACDTCGLVDLDPRLTTYH